MVNIMWINGPFQSFKTTIVLGALEAMQDQGFKVMMITALASEAEWLKKIRKAKIPVHSVAWLLNNPFPTDVTCVGIDCGGNNSWMNEVLQRITDAMSAHPMATIMRIAN